MSCIARSLRMKPIFIVLFFAALVADQVNLTADEAHSEILTTFKDMRKANVREA